MDKKERSNVIPFPSPKPAAEKPGAKKPSPKTKVNQYKIENKRIFLSLALAAILITVTMANRNLLKTKEAITWASYQHQENGSRSLASIEPNILERNVDWENNLAKELSDTSGRKPASLSAAPSAQEKFRLEFLGSPYRVLYNSDGKLQEVQYDKSLVAEKLGADTAEPKYINSALMQQKAKPFLRKEVSKWQNKERITLQNEIVEVFNLLDKKGKSVGTVRFVSDIHGRFLSMKVESI